jgi:hypothetical protein
MPAELVGRTLRDAITGRRFGPLSASLPVENALATFPVALFTTE